MRKLLSSGLVMVGMASVPAVLSTHQVHKPELGQYRSDPRFPLLRRFFDRNQCPAARYSEAFLEAADHFALDWRLLPSLSFVESTGGKATQNNNMFGWDSGRAHFSSPAAGIYAVADHLTHYDQYRHKSLDELLAVYNPNAEYVRLVKSVMQRIAPIQ